MIAPIIQMYLIRKSMMVFQLLEFVANSVYLMLVNLLSLLAAIVRSLALMSMVRKDFGLLVVTMSVHLRSLILMVTAQMNWSQEVTTLLSEFLKEKKLSRTSQKSRRWQTSAKLVIRHLAILYRMEHMVSIIKRRSYGNQGTKIQ